MRSSSALAGEEVVGLAHFPGSVVAGREEVKALVRSDWNLKKVKYSTYKFVHASAVLS